MEAKKMKLAGIFGNIPTPIAVLRTSCGSLCYTTSDLRSRMESNFISQLEIGDFMHKSFSKNSSDKFIKYDSNIMNSGQMMSARHMDANSWIPSTKGMKVSTHAGLKLVTVDDYMSRVVLDRPKYVVAIADEISHVTSTDKRKLASMFRTLEWFKKMCKYENKLSEKWEHTDISLFGVVLPYQTVEGGSKKDKDFSDIVTKKISEMVNTYLDSGASGICVGGLGMGENHVVRRSAIENVRRIIDIRATSTPGTVSEPVPIMVQGMNSLNEILEAIDAGVDVVASNYPSIVTSLGHGIHWNLRKSVESEDEVLRIEDGIINLWDAKYEEDPSPLMEGCQCHACLHHTKQYIHHLLVSHELLGEVLLYAHNQHQLLQLFEEARKHKEAGTFGNWIDQHCQATIL